MRILGLDIGTTSIGSALIDWEEKRNLGKIVHAGVRIFPEGVTDDKKEPLNQQKRTARLVRRTRRRRKLRKRLLNQALAEAGLLPPFGTPEWNEVMGGKKGTQKEKYKDPYILRKRGVAEKLEDPFEVGRAFYHLAQRRGMRGRAVSDDDKESREQKEEHEAEEAAKDLEAQLQDRTLGQHLAAIQYPARRRGHHLTRGLIDKEFERLWDEQAKYHSKKLTPELKRLIRQLIFFQRRTFWRLSTLRKCRFVPDGVLEPKGSWAGQHHVMLEQINKLRIAGGNARPLDPEEKQALMVAAMRQASMSWGGVRRTLRPIWKRRGEPDKPQFNMEMSKAAKGIKGNALEAKLIKIFGEAWDNHPARDRIRAEIYERLFEADYLRIGGKRIEIRFADEAAPERRRLIDEFVNEWGVTRDEAETLSKLDLPGGWHPLSREAIAAMRPHLENGVGVGELLGSPDWADWRAETFPDRDQPTGEVLDLLPSHPKRMPEARNPTVTRALNELRKVVNNLIRTYGKPDVIRVELAREVGKSGEIRRKIRDSNNARQRERKAAAKDLGTRGIPNASREDIDKWLLWKESNERCPYSGDQIGFDALFREGKFQVEHIWPRKESLDNRWINKTLCRVDINIKKGNSTPFKMWGNDPDAWDRLKRNLDACGLPENKKRRFLANREEMDEDEWAERQIRDTSWAARAARDFLKKLWPDDGTIPPVETVNGQVTAQLRYRWGLDGILNPNGGGKNRADHRHHAVDAIAVALTTRAFVKRLSDYYARDRLGERPALPKPWPSLFEDARQAVEKIVVSHRVDRKLSGRLHEQSALGLTTEPPSKSGQKRYVKRKPIHGLKDGEVAQIRDKHIREVVEKNAPTESLRKQLVEKPLTIGNKGNAVKRVRMYVDRKDNAVFAGKPEPKTFYELGQVLRHIAIYKKAEGSITHRTETRLEALENMRTHGRPVRKELEDGSKLLFSLCRGDTFCKNGSDGNTDFFVVRKFNQAGQIFFKPSGLATEPKPEVSYRPRPFIEGGCSKVSVDPIGRVRPARD